MSLEQAIEICTLEGAWVLGVENELGSIETGKLADMIVLDQNLFEIETAQIDGVHVLKTIIGGNVVYDRLQQGSEDVEDMMQRSIH